MADFITLGNYKPRITVPIRDLAQLYLDEGARIGVRGDVAFAQSILETGGFAKTGERADRQQLRRHRLVRQLQARLQLPRRADGRARAAAGAPHLRRQGLPRPHVHRQDPAAGHAEARLPRQGADVVGPVAHVGDGRVVRPAGVRHLREDGVVRGRGSAAAARRTAAGTGHAASGRSRASRSRRTHRRLRPRSGGRRTAVRAPRSSYRSRRAPSRTGRCRMPVCLLLRVHTTGPANSISLTRASNSRSTTRISSRARLAPRQ